MISLEWLKVKAFRSFVEETTFHLPTSGLILINGKNLQTNDASGTGKSTVFYGVAFALNILPSGMTAASLQSFLTKEKMQVDVGLNDTKLGKVIVGRGRDTYIEYGGHKHQGATLVNSMIEKVFGLTSQMLYTMAFRPQNSGGLFLSKNDTEKKDFLTALLGLDKIETAFDASDLIVKELTKELASINAQLTSKIEVLSKINIIDVSALIAESTKVSAEILDWEADREHWEAKLETATARMHEERAEVEAKYAELKKQCNAHINKLQMEDQIHKGIIDGGNILIQKAVETCKKALVLVNAAKARLPVLEAEIAKLESKTCFTCEREWLDGTDKLDKAKAEKVQVEFSISKEEDFKAEIIRQESFLQVHTPDPKIAELQEMRHTFDAKARSEVPIGTGSGEMNMLSKNYRKMEELTAILSKNKVQIEKQKEFQMLYSSINKEVTLLNTQVAQKEDKLQQESDFCKVLGKEGFLGSIFDEVLAEIVQEINNKLCNVANMSTVTFDFKTEVLNTKGVVKKAIVPMVTIYGNESKLTALSGGMLSSLEIVNG